MNRRSFLSKALGVAAAIVAGSGAVKAAPEPFVSVVRSESTIMPGTYFYHGFARFQYDTITADDVRSVAFSKIPKSLRLVSAKFRAEPEGPRTMSWWIIARKPS